MNWQDVKDIVKVSIVGGGLEYRKTSTLMVMVLAALLWNVALNYYEKKHPLMPAQTIPAPAPPPPPPPSSTAIDSPCSNNTIVSNGPVSLDCIPAEGQDDKHKQPVRKNP
jgi:hypothetical protein